MAHPFFDVIKYPWYRPEAVHLYDALCQHAKLAQPNTIVLLYQQSCAGLPALAVLGTPPADIWTQALDNLTSAGALRRLCELIQGRQDCKNENIQIPIREVLNAQPAVDTRIVSDDIVVLDRGHLREQLKALESDESHVKVLVVRGPAGTGKSHGWFLFERAALDKGAQPVYLCDGPVVTVKDVIRQLFAALEASDKIPPPPLTTDPAYYREVCTVLQEMASSKHRPLWIAIDDLGVGPTGGPLLDTEIRKFCDQFVLHMVNPAFGKWFRLMLIDYPDGRLPTKWHRETLTEDRTSDADVQQEHIIDLLRLWLVVRDRKMIDEELTALAGEVLAKAQALAAEGGQGEERVPLLQGIHDAVAETLKSLAGRAS